MHGEHGSSREKLQVSREMLMLCFTYFQVIPEFLDFLFTFGYQAHAEDPYFSNFCQRTRLSGPCQPLKIPALSWSGRELQLCYNLRSVEQSGPSDWSIRTCAVHHTFDVQNVRTNWIIIKGNDLMKDRIERSASGRNDNNISSLGTLDKAFAASLATHLLFCEWATEQWRWYIISLEQTFQDASKRTLTAPVNLPSSTDTGAEEFKMRPRTETQKTDESIFARISRTQTAWTDKFSIKSPKPISPVQRTYTDPESGLSQPLPPDIVLKDDAGSSAEQPQPAFENINEHDFSFPKLQKIQQIEEKAHAAVLVLKLNIGIIHQLKEYYETVTQLNSFPQEVIRLCRDDIQQFQMRIDGILNSLQTQILRLETLLRLAGDRKSLVSQTVDLVQNAGLNHDQLHSILEYQNTETNKHSTRNMILMTDDMNDIARKTKIETVSMKVITVVTLFFLPGTFISVSDPICGLYNGSPFRDR